MSNELIQELCNTPGVPGCEGEIAKIVLREIGDLCLSNFKDPMGNLIFQINEKTPNLPTILIDAHMDEVGFIISHIEENGMLRVIPLGGIDPKLFYGQRLTIWGKKRIEATVAAIPPHISDKNSPNITSVEDCLIDTGINIKKIKEIVSIGDQVTFSTECVIDNNRILSKSLDDRIGVYVLLQTIKKVAKKNLKCNLFASASVQEEMGLRGARIINSRVNPDFSIALEGTVSNDLPGVPLHKKLAKLGDGPEIRISDKYLIADRGFNNYLQRIATKEKIKYQLTAKNAGGTNSTAFQVTGEGSKATVLSVPVRYLHSPSSVCLSKDVSSTINLLAAAILNIQKFKDE
jgi:endoglucanase